MTTANDKLQKIAEALRQQTLEPAKQEAELIVGHAQREAERIVAEAHAQAGAILEKNRQQLAQERRVFETSLEQSAKQGLETLRQAVEQRLFREGLAEILQKKMADPKLIAGLIESIITAIDKAGIEVEIAALIPASVQPEQVTALLSKRTLELLKSAIDVGDFAGGAQVKLVDRHVTLDISDAALKELLGRFVRKDFREQFFQL